MTPYIPLIAFLTVWFSVLWLVDRQLKAWRERPVTVQTPLPPPPAPVPGNDLAIELAREALNHLARVAEVAINPPVQDGPEAKVIGGGGTGETTYDLDLDAERDPLESFLGAEFLRQDGAIIDPNDEDPFGIPGLKAAI